MADVFNVTAAYNQTSYVSGQLITVTISGNATATVTSTGSVGPLTIPIVAADGTQSTVSAPAESVTITTVTSQTVTIDTTRSIVDSSSTPRTWTVAANKLSISATA